VEGVVGVFRVCCAALLVCVVILRCGVHMEKVSSKRRFGTSSSRLRGVKVLKEWPWKLRLGSMGDCMHGAGRCWAFRKTSRRVRIHVRQVLDTILSILQYREYESTGFTSH
jgi:hypothetical protein